LLANWPLMPIHAVVLPDGRVLTYGSSATGQQTGFFNYDVWTPSEGLANGHLTLPNGTGTDTFCNAQLLLPQGTGEVLLAGGDNWTGTNTTNTGNSSTLLFSTSNNTLQRSYDMFRPRWYATLTTMPNGEIFVQGGRNGEDRAEVRKTDGTYRLLDNIDTTLLHWYYPRNFLAPDGRIFGYDSYGQMYYVDTNGNGALTNVGRLAIENRGQDASAAMFRPGKILQFGGASNTAVVIDINSGTPVVTPTGALSSQRRITTGTILPDGTVLATGGSEVYNQLIGVNQNAEIWNPDSGQWTVGATGALPRLYHSNAVLLPDGSVLVGGGGAPGPMTNVNAEIYYPPYLFTPAGGMAPRPRIVTAPNVLSVGQSFTVDFANTAGIRAVALVKTGSVTHSFDMDQRYVPLSFSVSGSRVTTRVPAAANDVPPGYYLLFLINNAGTPSVGKVVRIGISQ
jgi:Domain of unknown function (DUF1929)